MVGYSFDHEFNDTFTVRQNLRFAENKTSQNLAVAPWSWNFGPGLATVKSEMNDNERESKAVYLVQEEGKKKPTLETHPSPL